MIVCAALQLQHIFEGTKIIIPCCRHYHGFEILHDLNIDKNYYAMIQGFITQDNVFMNRNDAYLHAKSCGQIPAQLRHDKALRNQTELYSEDLY